MAQIGKSGGAENTVWEAMLKLEPYAAQRQVQRSQEQQQCSSICTKAFEKGTGDSRMELVNVLRVPSTTVTYVVCLFLTPQNGGC